MENIVDQLAAIAKYRLNDQDKKVIIDLVEKNEYQKIIPYLYRHKIQSLFFKHIVDLDVSFDLPDVLLNALSMQHTYLQFKHGEYIAELEMISDSFSKNSISYVVLKGVGLANSIYYDGHDIYRDYNDIDFLVEKSSVKKVDEILKRANYIQGEVDRKQQIIPAERRAIIYYSLNSHQEHGYVK